MLWCFGSRCWISTKAMPQLAGNASKNLLKASRPPAEAPSPTTGKSTLARFANARPFDCGRACPACRALRPVIASAFVEPWFPRGKTRRPIHLVVTTALRLCVLPMADEMGMFHTSGQLCPNKIPRRNRRGRESSWRLRSAGGLITADRRIGPRTAPSCPQRGQTRRFGPASC